MNLMIEGASEHERPPVKGDDESPTARKWFVAAAFLVVASVCLWLYRDTLKIGFLLDDLFHLSYLLRAFNGEPEALNRLLWSNWSSETTLTSYRPLVSFSLAADYALWQINAVGYHATNIAMFAGCSVLAGLIGIELAALFSTPNRIAIGITSGFLFAVYPLHPEAVAWVIGRVDLLCTLFTLCSFYLYLLHKRTANTAIIAGSLAAFVFALMSKEMAVTLPIAVTLLEISTTPKIRAFRPSKALIWMWTTLVTFAVLRTAILGTVVGGYGNSGWKTIKQGLKNFADSATLFKVLFGASEEFPLPAFIRTYALGAIAATAVSAVAGKQWRPILFLIGWTVVSVLPTFQIWHIWPNLVGSRLFFLGSVPFCILLSFAALGTANRIWLTVGLIALLSLSGTWALALDSNLQAWRGASLKMNEFRAQLSSYFPKLSDQSKLLIPTLPQDYKGGPILGRPEYLAVLCKPPFADKDYTDQILTLEPMIAGGTEYVGPSAFRRAVAQSEFVFVWQDHESKLLLSRTNEDSTTAPSIQLVPSPPLTLKDRSDWLHSSSKARPILSYDGTTVPGAKYVKVYISKAWFPITSAPRVVPPDPQSIEWETEFLPTAGSFLLPKGKSEDCWKPALPGAPASSRHAVHDVAVMAFDEQHKPVGLLSETVPFDRR